MNWFFQQRQNQTLLAHSKLKRSKNTFNDIPDDIEFTREQFYGKFYRSIKGLRGLKTKCLACQKTFSSKNRKLHAVHNHATTRPMKCELCDVGFFLAVKRMKHMNRKHRDDYKCTVCGVQFDRGINYVEHMEKEHQVTVTVPLVDDKLVQVTNNDMRFTKKVTAVRALGKLNNKETNSCDTSFVSSSLGPWKCDECTEEFDSSRAHRIHLRHHLNGGTFVKQIPEFVEPQKEIKTNEPNQECDICEKKFSTPLALSAHKSFKHKTESMIALSRKRKADRIKYDVDCDMCDFVSPRRDYVEHHVKHNHKPEFFCKHCLRTLSNYNIYLYHINESHPKAIEVLQFAKKCNECQKSFRTDENLKMHQEYKHGINAVQRPHRCQPCGVVFKNESLFEQHNQNHYHSGLVKFLSNQSIGKPHTPRTPFGRPQPSSSLIHRPLTRFKVKNEPVEVEAMKFYGHENTQESDVDKDPFKKMLERKIDDLNEPPAKRARLAAPSPTPAHVNTPQSSDDTNDKLEYLKYLQTHADGFKCGICGKKKAVRKYMLHHLKQHDEVPTYKCPKCPEKFVFRTKYDKHLLSHESHSGLGNELRQEMNVDEEHPKFQDLPKEVPTAIKCGICQMNFKLTIMLNRHNSTWHSDDNFDKRLSMSEQKAKKDEPKQEVAVLKLLKCKLCQQAFIKPLELKEHLKEEHNTESNDIQMDLEQCQSSAQGEPNKSGIFSCDKCKIHYTEKKFLENHQRHFCIHREKGDQAMNEQ